MPKFNFRRARGFTLIEVLVSMIILALGLLGLASLQGISLKNNQDAHLFSQANALAYEMSDRIKANKWGWIPSGATLTIPTAADLAALTARLAPFRFDIAVDLRKHLSTRHILLCAGAKILGGFTVGEGAKIGSNAVVVKEVPPGATVVGVPGRMVDEDLSVHAERFAAYGVVQGQDDPYAKAIQSLVEHTQELERSLAALNARLAEAERGEKAQRDASLRAVK